MGCGAGPVRPPTRGYRGWSPVILGDVFSHLFTQDTMDFLVTYLPLFMMLTLAVGLFSNIPVGFVLAAVGVFYALVGHFLGEFPMVAFFNFPVRVIGTIEHNTVYPAIPMLLFMGVAFEKSGVARNMLECLQVLMRGVPGRLAIAVTVLGILLGPLPGMIGVSVATLALLALPTMLEKNYHPSLATGAVAAAGTLGVIIPPSIMLFFLSGQMRVPMGQMFLAILIPSLMLSAMYLVYYLVKCTLDPNAAPEGETESPVQGFLNLAWYAVRSLALPVALISLVLCSIIFGWATPSQSGAIGAAGGIGLLLLNRALTWKNMHEVIVTTVLMTSMVFFIVMAAGMFSYPFRYFGGDELIGTFLYSLGLGDWGMLFVVMFIIFLLGFFMDWIEITIITLPIFLPVLEVMDFATHVGEPQVMMMWMGVLIGLVLQTSFMTPPFGFAIFFVKGASPPSIKLTEVYRGMVPLVGVQLLTLLLVLLFPMLATGLPAFLLE